jgi:hypothetical protein
MKEAIKHTETDNSTKTVVWSSDGSDINAFGFSTDITGPPYATELFITSHSLGGDWLGPEYNFFSLDKKTLKSILDELVHIYMKIEE